MIIAQQKRRTNIAEYVLYMWQVEDMIRACNFDARKIEECIVNHFAVDKHLKAQINNWYLGINNLMQEEKITQSGNLQVVINTVNELQELHRYLLKTPEEVQYHNLYQKAKPNIRLYEQKSGKQWDNEIEACFAAMYAKLLLKLQNKTLTNQTDEAINSIRDLLALLAKKFADYEKGELQIE